MKTNLPYRSLPSDILLTAFEAVLKEEGYQDCIEGIRGEILSRMGPGPNSDFTPQLTVQDVIAKAKHSGISAFAGLHSEIDSPAHAT